MDPLSVAAGILAIIGAGSTVGKGLKKIISARRLPDILLQLNNEVADLQYVVQDIQNLLQQQSQANRDGGRLLTTNQSLTSALERAKETLLALESLIAYQLTTVDSRTGRTNIDWISWLRVEPKVKSLKADIRTDRVRLSSALSLLASSNSLQLYDQVQNLCLKSEIVSAPFPKIADISVGSRGGYIFSLQDSPQAKSPQIVDHVYDSSQVLQTNSRTETPIPSSGFYQPQSSLSGTVVTPCELNLSLARSLCERDCDCTCHRRSAIRSPPYLNALLGALLIGYSINPWMTQSCDTTECRGHSTYITYTYAFPQWFLSQMVRLRITYDQSRGPELCLRVVKVCSEAAYIWSLVRTNLWNQSQIIQKLKDLFIGREASVLDVDRHGSNALIMAIYFGKFEVATFLIKAGSDIFQEDFQGLCAYTLYWQEVLARQSTPKGVRANSDFCPLFGDTPRLPLLRLPRLIRAYIGSSRKNFYDVLSTIPRSEVDSVDATGNTALSWAVRYCDLDSVQKLLLCGSDSSHRDLCGRTPLQKATEIGNLPLMSILLAAKSNVNSEDKYGCTALHTASKTLGGDKLIELLVSHGANVESQENHGWRPLHYSISYNIPANMHRLIQKGANINAADFYGQNALMMAVYNSYQVLRRLLCEEALEYDKKDIMRWSVLEHVAFWGNMETIRILQSSPRMRTLDLDGSNALSIAKWRRDDNNGRLPWARWPSYEDPQLQYSTFEALWNSIAEAQQRDIEGDSETGSIEEGEAHDDEKRSVEDEKQTDDDGLNDVDDDDKNDDAGLELWVDAPESPNESPN